MSFRLCISCASKRKERAGSVDAGPYCPAASSSNAPSSVSAPRGRDSFDIPSIFVPIQVDSPALLRRECDLSDDPTRNERSLSLIPCPRSGTSLTSSLETLKDQDPHPNDELYDSQQSLSSRSLSCSICLYPGDPEAFEPLLGPRTFESEQELGSERIRLLEEELRRPVIDVEDTDKHSSHDKCQALEFNQLQLRHVDSDCCSNGSSINRQRKREAGSVKTRPNQTFWTNAPDDSLTGGKWNEDVDALDSKPPRYRARVDLVVGGGGRIERPTKSSPTKPTTLIPLPTSPKNGSKTSTVMEMGTGNKTGGSNAMTTSSSEIISTDITSPSVPLQTCRSLNQNQLDLVTLTMNLVSSRTQSVGFGIDIAPSPSKAEKTKQWVSDDQVLETSSSKHPKLFFNEINYKMKRPKDTWFSSSLNPLAELSIIDAQSTKSSYANSTSFPVLEPTASSSDSRALAVPQTPEESRVPGNSLDLASQSNVQDAFVIAVEQQARERLEKLSALKRIKPVDMTKLSQQLSEVPSGDTSELNGLIEAATGSPIYVTSVPELSSSQAALHRTIAGGVGGGDGFGTLTTTSGEGLLSQSPRRGLDYRTSPLPNVINKGGRRASGEGILKSPALSNGVRRTSTSGYLPSATSSESSSGVVKSDAQSAVLSAERPVPNGQFSTRIPLLEKPTTSPKPNLLDRDGLTSRPKEDIRGSQESVEVSKSGTSLQGRGSKSSSRESVVDSGQYANMMNMVEYDSGPHREMAVDVPDSFVPRNKTPPRYPPSSKSGTMTSSISSNNRTPNKVGSGGRAGNGSAATLPGNAMSQNGAPGSKPIPPPRINEKEGWSVNNNNTQPPHALPRTLISPNKSAEVSPSTDQADRIRKYQEELKKRREQEDRQAREEEFLRTSLRGSKKLQALEQVRSEQTPSPQQSSLTGFVNDAYETLSEDRIPYGLPHDLLLKKPVGIAELVASLHRVQEALNKNGMQLEDTVSAVGSLMKTPEFQQVLAVHNKVQDVWCFNSPPTPISAHSHQLVQECLGSLYNCSVPESAELVDLLSRVDFEGILCAHDKIAERERLLLSSETSLNIGESVDEAILPKSPRPAYIPEPQPDDHIKVVRIEKTQDPLGATVRNDGDAVIIGRIVKGGAAERSGLLHEGDEVLEVNGIVMRAKTVNEVCDILSRMTGTLTFLIVPASSSQAPMSQRREILIHVRAHFDYDPEDDIYVPCRELGIAFSKGDVLHVISQDDPNWWQAHREGEEDQALAGLIPSKSFQEQRETVKQTLLGETESREKSKRGTLLCAKTHKKKKKKIPYSAAFNDDFDAEEIPTYEEVSLYYPRASFKRPVVLIGPPNIGRHELRQRLMLESERFAAAVPHTSRTRKDGEVDGQDYHFITRAQFEADILGRKFVEHGEFEKAYYGTSLDAIRTVVDIGRICVLNLHPQSLKMLRNSDLKPYIVFVAPPPMERLKQMRISRGEAYKEEELIDIIEKAREMEEKYGHYFDLVIINNDIDRTYHELVQRINYIEREPQWVPAFWLKQ